CLAAVPRALHSFPTRRSSDLGNSKVEDDKLDVAREIHERAGGKLMLPVDHVAATAFENEARADVLDRIPEDRMGLDIGPRTIEAYREAITGARTVIWNGPMGVFEMPNFAKGTFAIAEAMRSEEHTSELQSR